MKPVAMGKPWTNESETMDLRENTKPRLEWIDLLRGLAMLLVIWGHVDRTDRLFFVITGPFKMPLFFAITGYLFKDRDGNVKEFLTKLVKTIIVPWIILSLVWLKPIYALIQGRLGAIPGYLLSFISGEDFWFMPCILIAECIFFLICKLLRDVRLRYLAMLVIAVAGIVLTRTGVGRFAMFDVACTAQIYLLFGYWFRNREGILREKLDTPKLIALILAYVCMFAATLLFYPGSSIDVHTNRYYNVPLCMAMSFVSLLSLFLLMPKLNLKLRWLSFVGRNTIVFYIVHYHARSLLSHGARMAGVEIPKTFLSYVVIFAFICSSMSIVALVINRWFPFVLGRRKSHESNI